MHVHVHVHVHEDEYEYEYEDEDERGSCCSEPAAQLAVEELASLGADRLQGLADRCLQRLHQYGLYDVIVSAQLHGPHGRGHIVVPRDHQHDGFGRLAASA